MIEGNSQFDGCGNSRQLRDIPDNIVDNLDRIRARHFQHAHHNTRFSVDTNDFRLLLIAVFDRTDILDADRNIIDRLHDDIFHRPDNVKETFSLQGIIKRTGFKIAGRHNKIGVCNNIKNRYRRQSKRLDPIAVQGDMNFPDSSSGYAR